MKQPLSILPFYKSPHSNSNETYFIADKDENFVARSVINEDADYLVEASNNYPEAIKLLEECKNQIEYLHGKFKETSTGNSVLARVKLFLNKID